jgi:lipoprotein NlpD
MEILKPATRSAGLMCVMALALAGCGRALTWDSPGDYTVIQGDTLYSIAWRNRLDWQDLARWNGLPANGLIYPGQVLKLAPPAQTASPNSSSGTAGQSGSQSASRTASPASSGVAAKAPPVSKDAAVNSWYWPASGPLLAGFGDKNALGNGLDIGGRLGDPVRAAASGRVVYAGSGLIGYGKLIIVKHNDTFLSAYGHNRTLAVKEGQTVKIGQKIAEIGEGPGKKPLLHFEIRLNGKPVDPIRYLPRR